MKIFNNKLFDPVKAFIKRIKLSYAVITITAGIIILFIIFDIGSASEEPVFTDSEEHIQTVRVEKARKADILEEQEVTGRMADNMIRIGYDRTQGKVANVYVSEGDMVDKGAILYDMDMTSDIVEITYQIKEMEVGINEIEVSLEQLNSKKNKLEQLVDTAVAKEDVRDVTNQIKQYESQKSSLIEKKNKLVSNVDMLKSYARVIAPKGGKVKKVTFGQGETIGQGDYVQIQTNIKPVCKIYVTQKTLLSINEGLELRVFVEGQEEPVQGHVTKIDSIGENEFLFPLDIELDIEYEPNMGNIYLGGKSVQVMIPIYSKKNELVVQRKAIINFNDETYVYCVDETQRAKKVPVVTGYTNKGLTQIKSGLSYGDEIIVEGQYEVTDGQKVELIN